MTFWWEICLLLREMVNSTASVSGCGPFNLETPKGQIKSRILVTIF